MRPRLHRRYGAAFRRRLAVSVRITPALLALAFTRGRRVKSNARCRAAVDDADAGVEVGPLLEDVAVEPQPGSERGAHGAS